MTYLELLFLAVGLSMDAFAVAVCKGLALKKVSWKEMCIVGLWFGGFQALMPAIGYLLGTSFEKYISAFDHWIAFGLLVLIGVNMIKESFSPEHNENDSSLGFKTMLVMAVATAVDALAVGITFSFLINGILNVIISVVIIGIVTFCFSCAGVKLGNLFGAKYKSGAELTGGIILILLGIKILLEHLDIIHF